MSNSQQTLNSLPLPIKNRMPSKKIFKLNFYSILLNIISIKNSKIVTQKPIPKLTANTKPKSNAWQSKT